MPHYQNTDVATKYAVSIMTVKRWIDQAKAGKNNLQLEQSPGGALKIINNSKNQEELLRLKQRSFR